MRTRSLPRRRLASTRSRHPHRPRPIGLFDDLGRLGWVVATSPPYVRAALRTFTMAMVTAAAHPRARGQRAARVTRAFDRIERLWTYVRRSTARRRRAHGGQGA